MGPVVVLEGPDGCGKSTVADYFTKGKDWEYGHYGAPTGPAYKFYRAGVQHHVGPTVLDRYHHGSIVYGSIFRGSPDLSHFQHWLLEAELASRQAVMVYVSVPLAQQLQVLRERNTTTDKFEDPDKQVAIREMYEKTIWNSVLPVIHFDWTAGMTPQGLYEYIGVDLVRRSASNPLKGVPALGRPTAPFILVGDEPSTRSKLVDLYKKHGVTDEVAASRLKNIGGAPFNSTSGEYLYQALAEGKLLRSVCVFNSLQMDGTEVKDLWGGEWPFADEQRVVALGRAASKRLSAAGVRHKVIPHPQWWRRACQMS